jgi:hypothetical protein
VGIWSRIAERMEEKDAQRADPGLLDPTARRGSEGSIVESDSADGAPRDAAREVRRSRDRSRWRWLNLRR